MPKYVGYAGKAKKGKKKEDMPMSKKEHDKMMKETAKKKGKK